MRSCLRFHVNGQLHEVDSVSPQLTLLEYLRQDCGLTGTKEGCAEGDCGACTVVVAEASSGRQRYHAMNACILFLPQLDGQSVITVEGLQDEEGALHPVQSAMVDAHGSQCGFCTPGFVMSLFALFNNQSCEPFDRDALNATLAGNLCRCTGYAPIVRAAQQCLASDRGAVIAELDTRIGKELASLADDSTVRLQYGDQVAWIPTSEEQFAQVLRDEPDAQIIAGATDVGLWVTKDLAQFDTLLFSRGVNEFRAMRESDDGYLDIGAAVTYREALPVLTRHFPGMSDMLHRLGGEQVRNAGTIGGNIANGSPIGDMPPALIALGAQLVLNGPAGERTLELEDFFIEYGKQDLRRSEYVSRIRVPLDPDGWFACYKLSKRIEQDISAVCAGIHVLVDNGTVQRARLCYGGVAGTPARARRAERALMKQPWSQATIDAAVQAMDADFTPISDWRASADYRRLAAGNLLQRVFDAHRAGGHDD